MIMNEDVTTGAVGSFVGSRGQGIDDTMGGSFYPSTNDLLVLLKHQRSASEARRKYVDDNTQTLSHQMEDTGHEYVIDPKVDNSTPEPECIEYDDSGSPDPKDAKKFINTSETEMIYIGENNMNTKITKESIQKMIREAIADEMKGLVNEDLKDYLGADYKDYKYSKQPIPKVAKQLIKLTDIYASNVASYLKMSGDFLKPGMTVALNKYLYEKLKKVGADQGHKGSRSR